MCIRDSVSVSGPDKFVASALAAVEGVHRQYARQQEPFDLTVEEAGLVKLHLRELRALVPGVSVELQINENRVVLGGTAEPVEAVKAALEALLVEAEENAVPLTCNL